MKRCSPLLPGLFRTRYKRFFAEVETSSNEILTLHCPNTGSMKNCMVNGSSCWYSLAGGKKRKLPGTLELVSTEAGNLAGINSALANKIVQDGIRCGTIDGLSQYPIMRTEVRYGEENSRIDILLEGPDKTCFVEVKNVTLDMGGGLALFPDSVTSRGTKHLRELMRVRTLGYRAVLFFCVQINGIDRLGMASHIDAEYVRTLYHAIDEGVEVMAWQCQQTQFASTLISPIDLVF